MVDHINKNEKQLISEIKNLFLDNIFGVENFEENLKFSDNN